MTSPFHPRVRDVIEAVHALISESQGGLLYGEMHSDALIPHSNGYAFGFLSPKQAEAGITTKSLTADEVEERVMRWLRDRTADEANDARFSG